MCTDISVNLPTVTTFLLLYSLRSGSIVILFWTLVRSLSFLAFFVLAIIETFLPMDPPLGAMFMTKPSSPSEHYYLVFTGHLIIIISECFLFLFSFCLGIGIYYVTPYRVSLYLICRFCAWMAEVTCLVVLSLSHHNLIGWYLLFAIIIILEFYSFIVVYSYYVEIVEESSEKQESCEDLESQGPHHKLETCGFPSCLASAAKYNC